MSLYFHKRKKIGGFNFNFSKNGIGTSMKLFKGCNIGVDARGRTYISGGLFGFRYREYLDAPGLIKQEPDPKKEFFKIIPNKYKSNVLIGLSYLLFWFFAYVYAMGLIGLFIPNIEKPPLTDYLIMGFFIFIWCYSLYFSVKAKQRHYTKRFINFVLNDAGTEALDELQKVIKLEKNKSLLEQLEKIKNTLIIAIDKKHQVQ